MFKKQNKLLDELIEICKNKYTDHYKDFNETVVRDFSDALISAKNEALAEGKESAPYLTDENLAMSAMDLFFGIKLNHSQSDLMYNNVLLINSRRQHF